jgi:hypothetical protein
MQTIRSLVWISGVLITACAFSALLASGADLNALLDVAPKILGDPNSSSSDIELTLTNRSAKDIVYMNIQGTTTMTGSGGRVTSAIIVDYVPSLASVREATNLPRYTRVGAIHPGEEVYQLLSGGNRPNGLVTFRVTTLIFGDNTALGDPTEIRNVFSEHKGAAEEAEKWLRWLVDAPPDLKAHVRRGAQESSPRAARDAPTPSWEEMGRNVIKVWFKHELDNQAGHDMEGVKSWYDWMLAYLTDYARAYRDHSELKEGV